MSRRSVERNWWSTFKLKQCQHLLSEIVGIDQCWVARSIRFPLSAEFWVEADGSVDDEPANDLGGESTV